MDRFNGFYEMVGGKEKVMYGHVLYVMYICMYCTPTYIHNISLHMYCICINKRERELKN